MPRAVIPERLRLRQVSQQVAVVQREAASAESVIVERVAVVEGGLPPDLQGKLDIIEDRLNDLENPTP